MASPLLGEGMDIDDRRKRETEALIEAIWGPQIAAVPRSARDPTMRAEQNAALAEAMRAYLLEYLVEVEQGRTLNA